MAKLLGAHPSVPTHCPWHSINNCAVHAHSAKLLCHEIPGCRSKVLDATGCTHASDVYSFGIVAWEVVTRELPWAIETCPRDIYIRVVLKGLRPAIPDDTPADIANVARACWAGKPDNRPTFSAIMESMKSNGWNE